MYNTRKKKTPQSVETTSHQGGVAYALPVEHELVSMLFTGFGGSFYEAPQDRIQRLERLLKENAAKDVELTIKAVVYARTVVGQRSICHYAAAYLAKIASGSELLKYLYTKYDRGSDVGGSIFRVSDMAEILAAGRHISGTNTISNAMKKGFKAVIEGAKPHELAKYAQTGKEISLHDLMNLTHPKSNKRYEVGIKAFKAATTNPKYLDKAEEVGNGMVSIPLLLAAKLGLIKADTHEARKTVAGQEVAAKVKAGELSAEEAATVLEEEKSDIWEGLISTNKLGFMALTRNLYVITKSVSNEAFAKAMELLTNSLKARKSGIYPHQVDIALRYVLDKQDIPSSRRTTLVKSVEVAYENLIPNLTQAIKDSEVAVFVDSSGSMGTRIGWNRGKGTVTTIKELASLIGATFAKAGGDLFMFDNDCKQVSFNPLDSVNTIKNTLLKLYRGGGTYFSSIYPAMNKYYDILIVVSDMQGADNTRWGSNLFESAYNDYVRKWGKTPTIVSVDIQGYGTTMFDPTKKVARVYGYGAEIYDQVVGSSLSFKDEVDKIKKVRLY